MLSFFLKQSRRKGFTIIELIVVVAIIGIMAAIAIPVLSAGRNRGETGNAYAKSYYYAMQDIMMNYERSGGFGFVNPAGNLMNMKNSADNNQWTVASIDILLVTEVKDGVCTDVKMYRGTSNGYNAIDNVCNEITFNTSITPGGSGDSEGRAQKNDATMKADILEKLGQKMAVSEIADGYLYAYMDLSYRIEFAYWSDGSLDQLRMQTTKTQQTGTNIVGMYVYGSYPKSRSIYVDTDGTENLFDPEL